MGGFCAKPSSVPTDRWITKQHMIQQPQIDNRSWLLTGNIWNYEKMYTFTTCCCKNIAIRDMSEAGPFKETFAEVSPVWKNWRCPKPRCSCWNSARCKSLTVILLDSGSQFRQAIHHTCVLLQHRFHLCDSPEISGFSSQFPAFTGNMSKFPVLSNISTPICSMYGIFTNICPKNHPNVVKYTIHGAYFHIFPAFPAASKGQRLTLEPRVARQGCSRSRSQDLRKHHLVFKHAMGYIDIHIYIYNIISIYKSV